MLRIAQAILIAYIIMVVCFGLLGFPSFHQHVITGTVPSILASDGVAFVSNEIIARYASVLGLGLDGYAWFTLVTGMTTLMIGAAIGALVFWRLPNSWFGLITASVLMLTPTAALLTHLYIADLPPLADTLIDLGGMVWPLFFLWLYLFPNGCAVPHWTLWLAVPIFVYMFTAFLLDFALPFVPFSADMTAAIEAAITSPVQFLVFPLILGSQVYRYRFVSGPVEREQTKWFVFGLIVFMAIVALFLTLPRFALIINATGHIELIILPIVIGISILRYRLWDIDVIIRRTTSYAISTVLLLLIYFGSVIVLQRLFTELTGQSSTIAVVLSTLLIAAMFLPVRRRVQDWVDRRFFRQKYNAEKVLEQFAATVRDETDLDALTAELVRVIQETMQPATISIALFEDAEGTRRQTPDET